MRFVVGSQKRPFLTPIRPTILHAFHKLFRMDFLSVYVYFNLAAGRSFVLIDYGYCIRDTNLVIMRFARKSGQEEGAKCFLQKTLALYVKSRSKFCPKNFLLIQKSSAASNRKQKRLRRLIIIQHHYCLRNRRTRRNEFYRFRIY